jgi:hypothetical protein
MTRCIGSNLISMTPEVGDIVRFSHSSLEYGLDEIVGGFDGARSAFGPLRQSVG